MSNLAPLRVQEETVYLKVNELPEGTLKGTYKNSRDGEFGKTHFFIASDSFSVEIKGKKLNVSAGDSIGLNGTSGLDWSMEEAKEGMELQIDYKGKKAGVSKEGKKFSKHIVDVNRVVND